MTSGDDMENPLEDILAHLARWADMNREDAMVEPEAYINLTGTIEAQMGSRIIAGKYMILLAKHSDAPTLYRRASTGETVAVVECPPISYN